MVVLLLGINPIAPTNPAWGRPTTVVHPPGTNRTDPIALVRVDLLAGVHRIGGRQIGDRPFFAHLIIGHITIYGVALTGFPGSVGIIHIRPEDQQW